MRGPNEVGGGMYAGGWMLTGVEEGILVMLGASAWGGGYKYRVGGIHMMYGGYI